MTMENDEYKKYLQVALSRPLPEKVSQAILFLQMHENLALSNHPEGYYLAYSGGKDSTVLLALAKMAAVKHVPYYNQTTIDPPELVRHIQEQENIIWNRPDMNLIWAMTGTNGPPTRLNRWCCKKYKEQGGDGRLKLIGVRAAESNNRAATWREIIPNRNGGTILCPILYWTDEDVWTFIRHFNLSYCSLYDEGFTRLGCVGCPMSGKKGVRRDFERWPGFERLWKLGFQKYFQRWKGVPRRDGKPRAIEKFNSWQELWDWWISREKWKPAEECQGQARLSQISGGTDDDDDAVS